MDYTEPPAIVVQHEAAGGLENRLSRPNSKRSNFCDKSYPNVIGILKELMMPLEIRFFYDEKTGYYYEFMTNPNLNTRPIIAVQVYIADQNKKPVQLDKIVYLRKGEALVIYYKYGQESYSTDGIVDWTNTRKVQCIKDDEGRNKLQVMNAFRDYLRLQQAEKMREERREHERMRLKFFARLPHKANLQKSRIKFTRKVPTSR